MFRMNERRPTRNRIKTPVNEYPEFCVAIPLRKRMLVERFETWFEVRRGLRLQTGGNEKTQQQNDSGPARSANLKSKHSVSPHCTNSQPENLAALYRWSRENRT